MFEDQTDELCKALYQGGEYRLSDPFTKHGVTMSDWFKMSFEQKKELRKNLFSFNLTPSDVLGDVTADIKFQLLMNKDISNARELAADAQN